MAATIILLLLNGIIFLGSIIDLIKIWIGPASYLVVWFIAPIFSPAFLFLPWFDAWVMGEPVNEVVLYLWLAFIVCVFLNLLLSKIYPEHMK
jgi:hypothetical protein